jgi:ubiquinone/menaquinone biosynthesis C-methylase UbiE
MPPQKYVHGYSTKESFRLLDQAQTLTRLLHHDTLFPAGSKVLEAGCGVGAQTVILAGQNPASQIVSLDVSEASLEKARTRVKKARLTNVSFQAADIFNLPYPPQSFDHVFVCFVLEHLPEPVKALRALKALLKKGGTMTVIEGDHGSCYFYPPSQAALQAIACLVRLQAQAGGNALIGRQMYSLLSQAGFQDTVVSPRTVYVDASKPELISGFTRKTFTAMVAGVREAALGQGLIDPKTWKQGIRDLLRTARPDGMFSYTFFKGKAKKA